MIGISSVFFIKSAFKKLKNTIFLALTIFLPKRIKSSIVHLGFNLDRAEFNLFAYKYCFAPHPAFRLRHLEARGWQPQFIVDVGAFKGEFARMCHDIWPTSKIVMIEANHELVSDLLKIAKQINGEVINEVVGSEMNREVDFYVMGSGSSYFSENSPLPRTIEKKKTKTLAHLLQSYSTIDLLKLDVQGAELEALMGFGDLSKVGAILVECSLIQINKGSPLVDEVISYLSKFGFVICDVIELHRRPLDGATNQIDLLFVRKNMEVMSDTRHYS